MGLPFENVKRDVHVLRDESTEDKYGTYPAKRTIAQKLDSGFILLDKPSGIRSRTAAETAKRILSSLGVNKLGYSGTLEQ